MVSERKRRKLTAVDRGKMVQLCGSFLKNGTEAEKKMPNEKRFGYC